MGHAIDRIPNWATAPSVLELGLDEKDEPDDKEELQSLRTSILKHLATAVATAAEKIAQDTAGKDVFGEDNNLARRTHALAKLAPALIPLLPEPEDNDSCIHPDAPRLLAQFDAELADLPACPFCGIEGSHRSEDCNANPDGHPAELARRRRNWRLGLPLDDPRPTPNESSSEMD